MLLSPNIEITKYGNDKYILHNGKKRYFVINEELYQLVEVLKEANSLDEAYEAFIYKRGAFQTFADFRNNVEESLKGKDILASDTASSNKTKKHRRSIHLRITLIPSKIAGSISALLEPLYNPSSFFPIFALSLVGVIIFLAISDKSILENSVSSRELLYVFILFVLSAFLHELGHISACKKFGGKYGGIGIGLYLILPVFWADIHGVWMLPKKERIIANLAGIYIQMIMSFMLIGIYLANRSIYLLYGAYLISSAALFQLWPFIRLDGYWCVSDLTNTPKLWKTSMRELKYFLQKTVSNNRADYLHSLTTERMVLIGYSAFFFLVIIGLVVFLL